MAKFSFRLRPLLKVHQAARDERRSQLAQAYQADQILQDQQQEVESEIQSMKSQTRDTSEAGPLNVDRLLGTHRYELVLQSQRQLLHQQRGQLAEEIGRRREMLLEADKKVKALEKLREKQLQRHRLQESRRDIKLIDEVALRCTDGKDI